MAKVNTKQAALAVGLTAALFHAVWAIAVAVGFGQQWINWKLANHFVIVSAGVAQFAIGTAILSVVLAFICGAVVGWVFAAIWNWVGTKVR